MTSPPSFQVLFISDQDGGTRRYRCHHPQEQLERQGIVTGFHKATDFHLLADALNYDIFILHRAPHSDLIGRFLALVHQRGKIAIFETDDLVFEPELVQCDGYYRSLSPIQARRYLRRIHGHLKTLEQCDYGLTSTEFLAERLESRGKRSFIHRNSLSAELVQISEEAYQRRRARIRKDEGEVVIGYSSGSVSHEQDFAVVSPVLSRLMERYTQVRLHIFGHLSLGDDLTRLGNRVERTSYMRWQELPYALSQIDINLAPLELDNPFCQSKSELKYFEAGILGIPTVASRTQAFEFAIRHGETGFLTSDTDEWMEYLELLITDPNRRRAVGEAARRDVLRNYTPEARGRQLSQLLRDLVAQHRPDPNLILEPAQVERRVVDHLSDVLGELTTPFDPSQPSSPEDDFLWRRHYLTQRLGEILIAVRLERHRPLARLGAWMKYMVKKLTRQVYRLEREEEVYQLMGELTGGQVYGQTFQSTAPNLCCIDVLFATFGRVNTPDLVFRLKESTGSEVDIVTRTVSASKLHDNRFYPFTFPSLPDSAGKCYYFSVESPGAVWGDAVGLWTFVDAQDAAGTMYKNNQSTTGRLAYTAHYEKLNISCQ